MSHTKISSVTFCHWFKMKLAFPFTEHIPATNEAIDYVCFPAENSLQVKNHAEIHFKHHHFRLAQNAKLLLHTLYLLYLLLTIYISSLPIPLLKRHVGH